LHGIGEAIAVIAANAWLWRRAKAAELRNAGLMIDAVLVTPYSIDYDTVVVMVAMAFFIAFALREGFWPWERTLLAAAWMLPGIGRQVAEATLVPAGFFMMALLFILVLRRAGAFDLFRRSPERWSRRTRQSSKGRVSPVDDEAVGGMIRR
jgi:alpha-1,2-mannosyltransferase